MLDLALGRACDQDGIGERRRIESLAHPPGGEKPHVLEIPSIEHQQIQVPLQHDMLKPIVKQVHRAPEARFGQPPGEVTVRRHQHACSCKRPSEHQRLITCTREVGTDTFGVSHDHDAICWGLPIVAPAEDRGPLTDRQQQLRDMGDHRRLAAAADRQAADADDRAREPPARVRMMGVPKATLPGKFTVEGADKGRGHWARG